CKKQNGHDLGTNYLAIKLSICFQGRVLPCQYYASSSKPGRSGLVVLQIEFDHDTTPGLPDCARGHFSGLKGERSINTPDQIVLDQGRDIGAHRYAQMRRSGPDSGNQLALERETFRDTKFGVLIFVGVVVGVFHQKSYKPPGGRPCQSLPPAVRHPSL